MPKCKYRNRPSDAESCNTLASAGKELCPRHEFMQGLKDQRKDAKEQAAANGVGRMPKSRAALVDAGYTFTGPGTCTGCSKQIEWWLTPNGRNAPFDPMKDNAAHAVSHFANCSRANNFRRAS